MVNSLKDEIAQSSTFLKEAITNLNKDKTVENAASKKILVADMRHTLKNLSTFDTKTAAPQAVCDLQQSVYDLLNRKLTLDGKPTLSYEQFEEDDASE